MKGTLLISLICQREAHGSCIAYAVGDTYCVQVIRTEANQIKVSPISLNGKSYILKLPALFCFEV